MRLRTNTYQRSAAGDYQEEGRHGAGSDRAERDRAIVAAEAEAVGQHLLQADLAGRVRDVVQVATGFDVLVVPS